MDLLDIIRGTLNPTGAVGGMLADAISGGGPATPAAPAAPAAPAPPPAPTAEELRFFNPDWTKDPAVRYPVRDGTTSGPPGHPGSGVHGDEGRGTVHYGPDSDLHGRRIPMPEDEITAGIRARHSTPSSSRGGMGSMRPDFEGRGAGPPPGETAVSLAEELEADRRRRLGLSPELPVRRRDVIRPPGHYRGDPEHDRGLAKEDVAGYRPPPTAGPDKRTLDRMSTQEQRGVYGERLDKEEVFFRHHYGNGKHGDEFAFDREALSAAAPIVRARFAHLEHMRQVRSGIEAGVPKEELHAPGAHERFYERAHYEGGIVMRDPKRPGAFYLGDPKTGRRIFNPGGSSRNSKVRQLMRNQKRLARSPAAREAVRRGQDRRDRQAVKKLLSGKNRNNPLARRQAAQIIYNQESGPMVDAFASGVDPSQFIQSTQRSPVENLTPSQRNLWNQMRGGTAYQAQMDRIQQLRIAETNPISNEEYNRQVNNLNARSDAAAERLASLGIGETGASTQSPRDARMPDIYQNMFGPDRLGRETAVYGSAGLSPGRGERLDRYHQGWLDKRARRYGKERERIIGRWRDPITTEMARPRMVPHGPSGQTHFTGRDQHYGTAFWDEADRDSLTASMSGSGPPGSGGGGGDSPLTIPRGTGSTPPEPEVWGYPEDPTADFFHESPEAMAPYLSRMPVGEPLDPEAVAGHLNEALGSTWFPDGTNDVLMAAVLYRLQHASPEDKRRIVDAYKTRYDIDLKDHIVSDYTGMFGMGTDRQVEALNTLGLR